MRVNPIFILITALLPGVSTARAQTPPPNYGLNFCTVGSPGNAAALPADFPNLPFPMGQVNQPYRIAQTELTNTQLIEFVRSYVAANPAAVNDPGLRGTGIILTNPGATPPIFAINPGAENAPATMDWYTAARYCNWLQNGKAPQLSAFETGAYDTSGWGPGGTGQVNHSPNALFWIPTFDEWTKAGYFDPNRYGAGQGGYWLYPNRSNTPPVGGLPGTPGAETGAGNYTEDPGNPFRVYPVGSYPNATTPWGLLDVSGGVQEWNDSAFELGVRLYRGSDNEFVDNDRWDRLDIINGEFPTFYEGLRVASAVPSPSTVLPMLLGVAWIKGRSRPCRV